MKKYEIRIYPTAKNDLKEIVNYISFLPPDKALYQYKKIITKILMLQSDPFKIPVINNQVLKTKGYRLIIVETYIIFYVVRNNIVQIRGIVHLNPRYNWLM